MLIYIHKKNHFLFTYPITACFFLSNFLKQVLVFLGENLKKHVKTICYHLLWKIKKIIPCCQDIYGIKHLNFFRWSSWLVENISVLISLSLSHTHYDYGCLSILKLVSLAFQWLIILVTFILLIWVCFGHVTILVRIKTSFLTLEPILSGRTTFILGKK